MDNKSKRRKRIHQHIRRTVSGTAETPRLSVYRSNKEIYAQLIDDVNGQTLAAASSLGEEAKGTKVEISETVGKELAEKADSLGIKECVFDRSGYLYHGRVKALADGARAGGLKF